MTSREDEIKKLIADIDNLLSSGKRLPKLLSSQGSEPREVLERIRTFLVQLNQSQALENDIQKSAEQPQLSPLLTKFADRGSNQSSTQEQSNFIPQELKSELSAFLQPLQAELTAMLQERATLAQEIRQLEQKRLHHYSLSQQWANQEQMISEFLQVLTNRLVPNLTPQLTENLASPNHSAKASDVWQQEALRLSNPELTTQPFLESSEQAQRLTQLAKELDRRLLSLDGTVNVVFDALQRNINTYHESLSQALARMHSTGVQGEQLMASFLNNLTQYLQQQSLNLQPVSTGENETQLRSPSLLTKANAVTPEAVKPDPSTEVVSQVSSSEAETLFALASDREENTFVDSDRLFEREDGDIAIEEDLDAVLLQLGIDTPFSSSDSTTVELSPDIELVGDEVDLLYASLFGTASLANSSQVDQNVAKEDLSSSNIADTTTTPSTNLRETEDVSAAIPSTAPLENPVEQIDAVATPDPWLGKSDAGLLNLSNTNLSEASNDLTQPTSLLESWQVLFFEENHPATPPGLSSWQQEANLATDNIQFQPSNADTITTLTDLLTDVETEEQLSAVAADLAAPLTPMPTIAQNLEEVEINNDEKQEQLLDSYISASPQENLLSPEINQPTNVPDISLDEEQLQQLHQDLAKFDEQLDFFAITGSTDDLADDFSHLPLESLSEQQNGTFSPAEVSKIAPISLPQTEADLDFSPTTEKKKEVTTSGENNSIIADSPSINNLLDSVWYLGIDLGTTGISAALLNRSTFVVHPIYWSAENQPGGTSFQQSFRLPAEVYLPAASVPHTETQATPKKNLYSAQLKPYLQVAIPYKSRQQKWEPVLQFNEFSAGPLIWVVRSLSKLLLTLKSDRHSTTQGLIATAIGVEAQTFHQIINNIAGIICTCPSNWSEQYRFNVREALLTSKLVQHPQQVFFVEEAIASMLSILDGDNGEPVQISDLQGLRPVNTSDRPLVGNTLAINIGATTTEMALVDLPENLLQLTHQDFMLHGFAYASKGIEQDIICQLLFPPKYQRSRYENQADDTTTSNPWQWQPAFAGLDQMRWQSLGLEALDLPRVGEPDITDRIRLQQRLESSLLGQAVLDAALALKLILQHQDSFTLELADRRWVLQRRDLENQVFVPFVRRLNRELNKLLVARGIPTEAINQAVLTGGVASLGVANNWLRQKLPNARIIQDLYLGENGAPNCSRVAYGLAMLPLHPQVLEESRQQYTDYFLFTELLRLLPNRTLSFNEVLQLFENRGINTSICQQRLLAFLEGELPPGLIPSTLETAAWLAQSSDENPDYQAIANAPLFEKQGNLTYRPNSQQMLALRHYLDAIKASIQQSLEEPYIVNFVSEISHKT
ncbi:hypothetical protein I8752_07130 [Nostocaceae cyanobacterium CENA369]|uniref:Uncharacterized protein n=1 Tax=Dendronalium phyllosphericum CENA369 TaxID=1725256 RepID=A0A8J7HYT2_9NOST|nr:hypothetical protein [Dendronalium phyllosphericum]MBH8572791.1 hypothetical protein [Dendronalium phyllosphericum CENA369]